MTDQLPAKTQPKAGALSSMVPQNLDDAFRLAKALSMSGDMVPKHFQGKPEATMAAIVRGIEIGLAPMQALSNIAVINGRASIWGDALPALMQRAGHFLDVEITGEGEKMVAVAQLTRGDTGKTIVRSFSVDDAKKAGLWGKAGPWQQYPKRMLSLRARTLAARDGASDALMGLQVAEEVQDYPKDITPREAPALDKLRAKAGMATKAEVDAPAKAEVEEAQVVPDEQKSTDEKAEVDGASHWTENVDTQAAFPGSDEWTDGAKAFAKGMKRAMCPHTNDLTKAADWLGGYDGARRAGE